MIRIVLIIKFVFLISCQLVDNRIHGSYDGGSLGSAPSGLSYSSPGLNKLGQAIVPLTATVVGKDIMFSISPSLPSGLSLNTSTGEISGTPTEFIASQTYTITAQNAFGSTSADVNLDVAAVFNPDTANDTSDQDTGDNLCKDASNNCSLRAAIEQANALSGVKTFIEIATPLTINLTATLDITEDITITSPTTPNHTTLDGLGVERGVQVGSGVKLEINGLRIQNIVRNAFSDGAGIYSFATKLTLKNCEFLNNTINDGYGSAIYHGGGAVDIDNCTFDGNQVTGINRATVYISGSPITISNSTFQNNVSSIEAGALYLRMSNATITDTAFLNNESQSVGGGAIYQYKGILNIDKTSFTNNLQTSGGKGSAIYSYVPGGFNLTNSTVSGGNISAIYFQTNNNSATITNTTFFDNPYHLYSEGGIAPIELTNVTMSSPTGFSLLVFSGASIQLKNTILHGNGNGNCQNFGGTIASLGHNLADDISCALASTGDSEGVADLKLDPSGLTNNGGPTDTISLQLTSLAIDAGDTSVCPATDQRGDPRPVDKNGGGAICDIGAVEVQ